jgi:hypothetical protein
VCTPSVFISYRREDCPGHAGRLFDHLRARLDPASVFMDVTDIEAGVDFVEVDFAGLRTSSRTASQR